MAKDRREPAEVGRDRRAICWNLETGSADDKIRVHRAAQGSAAVTSILVLLDQVILSASKNGQVVALSQVTLERLARPELARLHTLEVSLPSFQD